MTYTISCHPEYPPAKLEKTVIDMGAVVETHNCVYHRIFRICKADLHV
jgi:hypothetical protein